MKIKSKIKKYLLKLIKEEKQEKNTLINDNDFTKFEIDVIDKVSNYTMTSPERIVSLIRAVEYVEKNNIEGDIVECGVWKGGSIMAVLKTLMDLNSYDRNIFLYDTFEGMSEPSENDKSFKGESATEAFYERNEYWERIECFSTIDEVKGNVDTVGYPKEKIQYIKGKVEDTIPNKIKHEKIAILRLDTDWYESTLHELKHLFPKIVKGGIIIIDDYGHWQGCKKAVDEYIHENNIKLYLNRIDYTCRIGVKI